MDAVEAYKQGDLETAITAALADVKASPGDVAARLFLARLLLFTGDLDRADRQLNVLVEKSGGDDYAVATLRQLIRAEEWRRQLHSDGRLPEFAEEPSQELRLRLEASIAVREGRLDEALNQLTEAESMRPLPRGRCGVEDFEEFRDLDFFVASVIEILTSNGKYFWLDPSQIESIEFSRPTSIDELIWRPASMTMRNGPDGSVFVPALYWDSFRSEDDGVRLGRATRWTGGGETPIRGIGQRVIRVGERDVPVLALEKVEFEGGRS